MEKMMNVMNENARISSAPYFTFDHIRKQIVGSEFNFKKSGIDGTPQYESLMAAMERHPSYALIPIAPTKKKQSYKGLTLPLMESYLAIYEGELANEARSRFAEMKVEKENGEMSYPTIKSWFLDLFPNFNVDKARREIQAKKLEKAKAPYKVIKVSIGVPHTANK